MEVQSFKIYNPNITSKYQGNNFVVFKGSQPITYEEQLRDNFEKRPVVRESATGLSSLKNKFTSLIDNVTNWGKTYKHNINHTISHKIDIGLSYYKLYNKFSMDMITHDLDKLAMYLVGFPKSFVSKFHRAHSEHHLESGREKLNVKTILVDNITSCPVLKPEKKKFFREYFESCKELQNVKGLKEEAEKYNFGEGLDFHKIKRTREQIIKGSKRIATVPIVAALAVTGYKIS